MRLYLASMSHYAAVNRRFAAFFAAHRPAARAAVELPLRLSCGTAGCLVAVECLASRSTKALLRRAVRSDSVAIGPPWPHSS